MQHMGLLVDDVAASVREHITLEREITNYWVAKYFEAERRTDPQRMWPARLLHWVRQVGVMRLPTPGHHACGYLLYENRGLSAQS
jgi:hypothetical protein